MGSNELEPTFLSVGNGDRISLVYEIVLHTTERTLCRTKCLRQLFAVDHVFADVSTSMTVLDGVVQHGPNGMNLRWDDKTKWIAHPPQHTSGLLRVVEACSGLGIMGKGFEQTGARTMCYVDNNKEYCRWLRCQGSTPVVEGDICDTTTVHAISKHVQQSHTLTGGFSCQPFSKLGDERHEDDPRSASFWGMLHAGYRLQSLAIILECTQEASNAKCVQEGLRQFSAQTGYQVAQTVLDLHTIWPARRTRWWAVIAHPDIGLTDLDALPSLAFAPGIMHLMPTPLMLTEENLQQLTLDEHELNVFYGDRKGIKRNMTDFCKPLPTATHSWGSQAKGCFCGCRESGFNPSRIFEKGLYAQFIQLESTSKVANQVVPDVRHMDPQEVAVLNALVPSYVKPQPTFHARLILSGVGQLASPIQSLWVLAQVQAQASRVGLFPQVPAPTEVLASLCKSLIAERNQLWSHRTKYMQLYEDALNELHDKVEIGSLSEPDNLTQEILQFVTREDSQGLVEHVALAQPAIVDPYQDGLLHDDTVSTPAISPTAEDPESSPAEIWNDDEELRTSIQLHTIDLAAATDVAPLIPFQINSTDDLIPHEPNPDQFFDENVGKELINQNDHPTQLSPQSETSLKTPFNIDNSSDLLSHEHASELSSDTMTIQTNRDDDNLNNTSNLFAYHQGCMGCTHSDTNSSETHTDKLNSLPDLLAHEPDTEVTQDLSRKRKHDQVSDPEQFALGAVPGFATSKVGHMHPSQECAQVPSQPAVGLESEVHASHHDKHGKVCLILDGEPIHSIQVKPDCTVGQLAVATDRLTQMSEPIRVTTAMGTQLPLNSKVQLGSHIRCQQVENVTVWKCRGPHGHSQVPCLQNDARATLLWQQEGWTAPDEMTFYMEMIQSKHPEVQCHLVDILPEVDYHVVITDIILKAVDHLHQDKLGALAMAVMYNHHWFPVFILPSDQIEICMPHDDLPVLRSHIEQAVGKVDFVNFSTSIMPHAFPADCGFQTLGWLISKILGDDTRTPFADEQACQWRALFHSHLIEQHKDQEFIHVPLRLGGMSVTQQLQQLLVSHGVHEARSHQCAEQLIDKLGKTSVTSILKSAKPWADLKARANMQNPPIRIVLADELKQAVQKRAKDPAPVGSKGNKRQTKTSNVLQIQADQIAVPDAIFKQADGAELDQINLQQINQSSKGIAVANIAEALPYFGIANPISSEGLGLLILDHTDPRIPPQHKVIQVPAHCRATQEPVIVTAAILQLGKKEVTRNLPVWQCKNLTIESFESWPTKINMLERGIF